MRRNYQEQLKLLPPGYGFQPSDKVLIGHYLKQHVVEGAPSDVIPEFNVYDMEPWKLPGAGGLDGEEGLYFLTKTRKIHSGGTRVNRKAGVGFWKVIAEKNPIRNSASTVIGYKRDLVYQSRSPSSSDKNWLMKEYTLSEQSSADEETVLCKITRSKYGFKGKKDEEYETGNMVKTTEEDDSSGNELMNELMNEDATPQQDVGEPPFEELSPSFFSRLTNEPMHEDATLPPSDPYQYMSDSFPWTYEHIFGSTLAIDGYAGYHQMPQPQDPFNRLPF